MEDATDLAVRASNGTTSSTLHNSLNANRGIYDGVATLGLGIGGVGGGARLSPERKHRMRELATQKLSYAYHLDEIAASVATMQSASALEDVAKLVLHRNPQSSVAKYVHFFHEKIPSRTLAQCTSLSPLDDVVRDQRKEGEPLRTRAIMKIFKEDYAGSARDLSEGLAIHRYIKSQHSARRGEMVLANILGDAERKTGRGRDHKYESVLSPEDQPRGLESQFLFQRAGVYLTIACQHIYATLEGRNPDQEASLSKGMTGPAKQETQMRRLEAGRAVRTNAKCALRDYLGFLSAIDYTPGLPIEVAQAFYLRENATTDKTPNQRSLDLPHYSHENPPSNEISKQVLGPFENFGSGQRTNDFCKADFSGFQRLQVMPASNLFTSTPPPGLPPYPPLDLAPGLSQSIAASHALNSRIANFQEAITYHPLLIDALNSLLLVHALLQTPRKEMLRHAYNVARCARLCDGYPIFLAARSPARADWIEIIRRTNNWLGLQQSWESLCAPVPVVGQPDPANEVRQESETEEQAWERRRQKAILEALADERVNDEASLQAAVSAREVRAEADHLATNAANGSRVEPNALERWAQEDGKEHPVTTDRAEAISRWIKEAPIIPREGRNRKGGRKKREGVRNGMQRSGIDDHGSGRADVADDEEDELD